MLFVTFVANFLEISAAKLFFFNRRKKCFEIPLAKAFAAFSLKNLKEDGQAVLYRFGEDLEQIRFFVAVA